VSVPPNCEATAWLPADEPISATESGRPLSEVDGLRIIDTEDGSVRLALGSGTYHFSSLVDPASPPAGGHA
jgi:hypothetical protein